MHALRRSTLVTLAAAVGWAGTAMAQSAAEARSEQAMERLSARYQQIWSALPPQQKQAFAQAERHWLNSVRWDEQQRCVARSAALPSGGASDHGAHCRAEILERHLKELDEQQLRASAS